MIHIASPPCLHEIASRTLDVPNCLLELGALESSGECSPLVLELVLSQCELFGFVLKVFACPLVCAPFVSASNTVLICELGKRKKTLGE